MNTTTLARQLRELAAFIDSLEVFELPSYQERAWYELSYFSDKTEFLKAVKSVGAGEKDWSDKHYFHFRRNLPSGAQFVISCSRDAVCRKVQEERWECEPLLSHDEIAQIGGGQ